MNQKSLYFLRASAYLGMAAAGLGCEGPAQNGTLAPVLTGNTASILQTYQPALAVRGANCLLCHAQINSNIITDFGAGDPQFFVGAKPGTIYGESASKTDSKPLTLPWYGNYFGTWQLATQINGSVIVPKVTISDPAFMTSIGNAYSGTSITLAQLLDLDLGPTYYGGGTYSGTGPIDGGLVPMTGNPRVAEIDQIYIGAPTASELLGLTKTLSAGVSGVEAIGTGSSIYGLGLRGGAGGTYITNTAGAVVCTGDIVISGTLFLNNLSIQTDDNGCRLMVTGSVFIQGGVDYPGATGTENLQISSATAVLLGFSPSTLATRFGTWYPDAQPLTRAPGTNTQKNAAILAEAAAIGSLLHDSTDAAACPTQMVTYEGENAGDNQSLTQCSINYQRLLLNAPNIQSRYVGQFTGVAIAEIALFAPGALQFAYDPTFNTVPILPQIPPVLGIPVESCGLNCGGGIGI